MQTPSESQCKTRHLRGLQYCRQAIYLKAESEVISDRQRQFKHVCGCWLDPGK